MPPNGECLAPEPLVLATRSGGKLTELRRLFAARGLPTIDLAEAGVHESPAEDDLEVYSTFEENARAKARYFFGLLGGRAVVAEDSGLEVDAIGGAPGVRSKRWSRRSDLSGLSLDAANNELLLKMLDGVADRGARYICAAVYVDAHRELVTHGVSEGWISDVARGCGGFGYDPYFVSADLGRTFAELSPEEKASVSHRGRAFRVLIGLIAAG
jgi:XTP/dITP diphosphohydrolase